MGNNPIALNLKRARQFLAATPIAFKFVLPFISISLFTTIALGAIFSWSMTDWMSKGLEEKSQMLATSLAYQIMDPLSMGEHIRVSKLLSSASEYDPDLTYAIATTPDGRVVASTDRSIPYGKMLKAESQNEIKAIRNGSLRKTGKHSFEITVPVRAEFNGAWLLTVGFSSQRQELSMLHVEIFAALIVMLSLSVGIIVYVSVIRRDIISPIRYLVTVAGKISKGDLKETISTDRQDEVGQLISSMNNMVVDLRDMAGIANSIASGDLSVQVTPRSEEDVFGQSFQWMVTCLNDQRNELQDREQQFRLLCETTPVGIVRTNADGVTVYSNLRWEQILGLETAEILHRPWYDFLHPEDRSGAIERWNLMKSGRASTYSAEFRFFYEDGEIRWGRCLAAPLRFADQSCYGFVASIEDITQRKSQEENEKRLALLEQREEFMATLSHDLKNPLIGANRVLELIAAHMIGEVTPRQSNLLLQLRDSNKQLLSMIQNLIDAYRFEKDVREVLREPADLAALAQNCITDIELLASTREVVIELISDADLPTLYIDSNAMRRVIQNLLDNSLKFTPKDGRITVRLQRGNEDTVRFSVADTGLGIAPEDQANLFKRFSQGKLGRRYAPGTGLGLFLCKQIVESHNGHISCTSVQGNGTTMEVLLPITVDSYVVPPKVVAA